MAYLSKTPKRRIMLSSITGALLTLAFAPFNMIIFTPIALICLMHVTKHSKKASEAFINGFAFGFTHLISSTYWVSYSITKADPNLWWLTPIAALAVPFVFAPLWAMVSMFSYHYRSDKIRFTTAFSVLYIILECGKALPGVQFPWNFLAYSLANHTHLVQVSYYLGTHLTGLLILAIISLIYICTIRTLITAFSLLTFTYALGAYNLSLNTNQFHDKITIRLVQPNFTKLHFNNKYLMERQLDSLLDSSNGRGTTIVNRTTNTGKLIVIWHEAALPYTLDGSKFLESYLRQELPKNSTLITGVDRISTEPEGRKFYNSMLILGNTSTTYDKELLVPFGEYIPLRNFFPFINKIAQGMGDFSAGRNQSRIINLDSIPSFRPLICYEIVFPTILKEHENPQWLLNITNDFWFEDSIGPHQHYAIAKFKAVETGTPLVRVANNGISAVVNQFGQELYIAPQFTKITSDFKIPFKITLTKFNIIKFLITFAALSLFLYYTWVNFFQKDHKK